MKKLLFLIPLMMIFISACGDVEQSNSKKYTEDSGTSQPINPDDNNGGQTNPDGDGEGSGTTDPNPGGDGEGSGTTDPNPGGDGEGSGTTDPNPGGDGEGSGTTDPNPGGDGEGSGTTDPNPGGDGEGSGTTDPNPGGDGEGSGTTDPNPGGDGGDNGTTTDPIEPGGDNDTIDMSKFDPKTDLFPTQLLYGRSLLTDPEEIKGYDFIMNSFIKYEITSENENDTQIILDFIANNINLTEAQVVKIWDYVSADDPRIMMITSTILPRKSNKNGDTYDKSSNAIANLAYFDAFFKGMTMKNNLTTFYYPHLDEMDINVKEILSVVKPDMTEAQKVRAIYDKFLSTVAYGEKNSRGAGNIRGAFLNILTPFDPPIRFVICQGYAQGLDYLFKRVGIQSIMVVGEGLATPGSPARANHAWNKVKIDDKWYIIDGTHDDAMIWDSQTCKHDYFLKSDNDNIIITTRTEGKLVDGTIGGYRIFPPANESMDISLTEYNK